MASQKIIDSETDKDAPLTYTRDDLYDHSNDTSILMILMRRLRKREKELDRLVAYLENKFSENIIIKHGDD